MMKKSILFVVILTLTLVLAQEEFECPYPNGPFKNPKDCYSFYLCINGRSHLRPCYKGTKWDDQVGQCIQESQANCQVEQSGL